MQRSVMLLLLLSTILFFLLLVASTEYLRKTGLGKKNTRKHKRYRKAEVWDKGYSLRSKEAAFMLFFCHTYSLFVS